MQVSHVETANTHAIMGGGAARAFSMSNSAEFFTVLSDTLYRDKKRAVVREVICNAWDAHIVSGKTDIAVEVTMTDEEMSIRDFGPGISDERIVPIYCVYGGSTKVESEEETGGFGLGSKAPFAYSDHFSVTSCHAGVKTIYAISRGGIETKGVPDMRAMVSVPTQETGLTVTIPIRSVEDRKAFEGIIRSVAYQGGMKVSLNGIELDRLDYTEARKSGFMVTANRDDMRESDIYVLYGTVLYPVSSTEDAIEMLRFRMRGLMNGRVVILVAPPNSVGVTPSREALSYTDRTIATVVSLGDSMIRRVSACLRHAEKLLIAESIESGDIDTLMRFDSRVSGILENAHFGNAVCSLEAAKIAANGNLRKGRSLDQVAKIVGAIAARKFRNDRRSLRRAFLGESYSNGYRRHEDLFRLALRRRSMKLHLRAAGRAGALQSLFKISGFSVSGLKTGKITEIVNDRPFGNVVFLAQSRVEALSRAREYVGQFSEEIKWSRSEHNFVAAAIPRNKSALRAAFITEMEKVGMKVIEVKQASPKKPKVEKPKDKWLDLKSFGRNYGFAVAPTLEEPEYYVRFESTIQRIRDTYWMEQVRQFLLERFENIAVVRGDAQVERIKKTGAKDAILELSKVCTKALKTRDGQIAALLSRGILVTDEKPYGVSSIASDIVYAMPEMFFDFVPVRPASKQRVIEIAPVLKVLIEYFRNNQLPKTYSASMGDFIDAQAEAAQKFKGEILSWREFEHYWSGLSMISTYRLGDLTKDAESRKILMKMVRVAKRTTPYVEKKA